MTCVRKNVMPIVLYINKQNQSLKDVTTIHSCKKELGLPTLTSAYQGFKAKICWCG